MSAGGGDAMGRTYATVKLRDRTEEVEILTNLHKNLNNENASRTTPMLRYGYLVNAALTS